MPKKLSLQEEQNLLKLLCGEIARDGGASFVTFIKEYDNVPLNKLLQGVKLLTFLESYPKILDVNRLGEPHFVKLLSNCHVPSPELSQEGKEDENDDDKVILDDNNNNKPNYAIEIASSKDMLPYSDEGGNTEQQYTIHAKDGTAKDYFLIAISIAKV